MRLFLLNISFLWLCFYGDLSVMAEVKVDALIDGLRILILDDTSDLSTTMSVDKQSETKVISNQKPSNRIFKPDELIFEELFETSALSNWTYEKFIHSNVIGDQTEDFTALSDDNQNINVFNGSLLITPTISTKKTGDTFRVAGCKQPACYEGNNLFCEYANPKNRAYAHPPPVNSARITTKDKFSFTYGRIEVNAALPNGDWLFPYIMLMPDKLNCTMRKQLRIAFATSVDLENNRTRGGPVILQGQENPDKDNSFYFNRVSHMSTDTSFNVGGYHNSTMIWKSKSISIHVDGKQYGCFFNNGEYDEPYHIILGVGAGGTLEFTDSNYKPWRNGNNGAFTHFHRSFQGCCNRKAYRRACVEKKNVRICSRLWGSQATMAVESVRVYAV